MGNQHKYLAVCEHQSLHVDNSSSSTFGEADLRVLSGFFEKGGKKYYSIINKGVKFRNYVGVLQVGNTTIEILPKTDKDEKEARGVLLDMLLGAGAFNVDTPSSSALQLRPNAILELYFEIFLREIEHLKRTGLIKRYRHREGNQNALKGRLLFNKHLHHNLVHQERFYVQYTTYDHQHLLHGILYKTLRLLARINTFPALQSRICALMLNFPEQPELHVGKDTFARLQFTRKNHAYRPAIKIARLLLGNDHPDVQQGENDVLALMFNMDRLWEKFVLVSLRRYLGEPYRAEKGKTKHFWRPDGNGATARLEPDILVYKGDELCAILDTKWKSMASKPTPDIQDLRQMYAYAKMFGAQYTYLVYPGLGEESECKGGQFVKESKRAEDEDSPTIQCGLLFLPLLEKEYYREWQEEIVQIVMKHLPPNT